MLIDYDKNMKILNIEQLTAGRGCKYLQCLTNVEGGELQPIAMRWKRKAPINHDGYVFIKFQ